MILIIILYISYEIVLKKIYLQNKIYNLAKKKAEETGKKLLVIGDPHAGILNKYYTPYGCGDLMIDLEPCSTCPAIQGKVEDILPRLKTNEYVIFESETIIFVPTSEIDNVISQMNRVSGGDIYSYHDRNQHRLFYHVEKYLYIQPHLFITKYPPFSKKIEYEANIIHPPENNAT